MVITDVTEVIELLPLLTFMIRESCLILIILIPPRMNHVLMLDLRSPLTLTDTLDLLPLVMISTRNFPVNPSVLVLMLPTGTFTRVVCSKTVERVSTMVFSLPELIPVESGTLRILGVQVGEMPDTLLWLLETLVPFVRGVLSLGDRFI
jgi:hypothetical protein